MSLFIRLEVGGKLKQKQKKKRKEKVRLII